jgi:hypothetical protein
MLRSLVRPASARGSKRCPSGLPGPLRCRSRRVGDRLDHEFNWALQCVTIGVFGRFLYSGRRRFGVARCRHARREGAGWRRRFVSREGPHRRETGPKPDFARWMPIRSDDPVARAVVLTRRFAGATRRSARTHEAIQTAQTCNLLARIRCAQRSSNCRLPRGIPIPVSQPLHRIDQATSMRGQRVPRRHHRVPPGGNHEIDFGWPPGRPFCVRCAGLLRRRWR